MALGECMKDSSGILMYICGVQFGDLKQNPWAM